MHEDETMIFSLFAVLFVGLKLGGVIDWPWLWVTAPIWGGMLASLVVVFALILVHAWPVRREGKWRL